MSFVSLGTAITAGALTGGAAAAAGVAASGAVLGAGTSLYNASQARVTGNKQADLAQQAVDKQRALLGSLKYEPIDIEKLKTEATANAISNAKNSLALERELSPAVAAARVGLSEQISKDLALGGKLSPDIANQVARASRTMGALSGAPAGPLTAASIGTTAEALKQQRLANASGLLAANKLPVSGLDPGAIAALEAQQNAAMNQFNIAKAGGQANLIGSEANVQAGRLGTQAGADASLVSGITDALGKFGSLYAGLPRTATPPSSLNFSGNYGLTGVGDTSGLLGSVQSTPVNYTLGSGGYVPGASLSGTPSFGQGLLSGIPTFGQGLPTPSYKPKPLT